VQVRNQPPDLANWLPGSVSGPAPNDVCHLLRRRTGHMPYKATDRDDPIGNIAWAMFLNSIADIPVATRWVG
jgi:hypothetical protein